MRRAIVVVAAALLAAACAEDRESPWAVDAPDPTPTAASAGDESPDGDGDSSDGGDDGGAAPALMSESLVADECFADEARCGRVLVSQRPDAPDLAAIGYRVWNEDATGRPLVILDSGPDGFTATGDDFPDRPVVVLGSRFLVPGGPPLSCPEWYDLDVDPPDDVARAATERCASRLTGAGIDLAGSLRDQQEIDVVTALEALGLDDFDIVASGNRADLLPAIAARFTVAHEVMLEPSLAPTDPTTRAVERLLQSLDFAWDVCGSAPATVCDPVGSIDDFLTLVADLGDAPLPFTEAFAGEDDATVDTTWVVNALQREATRPETVGFLPDLHRALLDRDATTVSRFVATGATGGVETNWLGQACSRTTSVAADFAALPAALRVDAEEAVDFFAVNCPAWVRADEPERDHRPGLVVVTASTPEIDRLAALADQLVVQPTVGTPGHACVVSAIAAYVADGDAATGPCTEPLTLADPTDVSPVEGRYVANDDHTVTLDVPGSWTDSGFGTWWRDADPIDLTNLDVYYYAAEGPEQAREEFVVEWSITDPTLTSAPHGDFEWFVASGGGGVDGASAMRQTVAVAQHDDSIVAVILQAEAADHDALVDTVLVPALRSVAITG